ncbi:MAG: hypothetical protein ABL958_04935 [Bdellovibrionia bacterium]
MNRTLVRVLIVSYLILPFFALLWKLGAWSLPERPELFAALGFTLKQATLSAFFSVAFGFAGALGLLRSRALRRPLEILFFLPNLLPTLFVLAACLKFFSPFPFGLAGIVLVHVVLNTGLAAVSIARILESRVGGWAELALVEGASRWRFFRAAFPSLGSDLGAVFLFIFAICFASLTVPLVAGRFDGYTTEVLIYEKVRVGGQWDQALGLSMVQTAIIFALTLALSRNTLALNPVSRNLSLLATGWGSTLPVIFSLIVIVGMFEGVARGIAQLTPLQEALMSAWHGTWIVGLGVGLSTFALSSAIVFASPHHAFQKFLSGYVAPSSVLTGFGILLFGIPLSDLGLMILGITLVQLPLFFRLYLNGPLEGVAPQAAVARTLGAKWSLIFRKITLPQLAGPIGFTAGLSAFWACGEFALSSLLTTQSTTLALFAKGLLASYRLEAATAVLWILMFTGTVLWLSFWGVAYGLGSKSHS